MSLLFDIVPETVRKKPPDVHHNSSVILSAQIYPDFKDLHVIENHLPDKKNRQAYLAKIEKHVENTVVTLIA